jgi:hypothetical protein
VNGIKYTEVLDAAQDSLKTVIAGYLIEDTTLYLMLDARKGATRYQAAIRIEENQATVYM